MNREKGKSSEKKTRNTGLIALGVVLMVFFICELLVYTWCRVQYTQVGYEISRATQEQTRLMAVQEELQLERARLKSPERLKRIAETSMGLKMPSSRQMVVVE
jgi:cell division protein FtsL